MCPHRRRQALERAEINQFYGAKQILSRIETKPRRGISEFRILDAFSSAPRRISGRVLVSASRGNLSTGSVRARSTRQRPEERGHSERTSGHLLVHDLSRQHTRIGTAGGGRRKRLKKSEFMGGESRGRVCVDEGVPQNESSRCLNFIMSVVIVLIIYNTVAAQIVRCCPLASEGSNFIENVILPVYTRKNQ